MKQKILDILKEKGSGFRVPDRYFDTIEDRLMSTLDTEKFPKESGFSVPANYFESLETQIFSKLEEESLSKDQGFKVPGSLHCSFYCIYLLISKRTFCIHNTFICLCLCTIA